MSTSNLSSTLKDSLFIIDWDNTLFSTSYLNHKGLLYNSYPDHPKSEMESGDSELVKELNALEEVLFSQIKST